MKREVGHRRATDDQLEQDLPFGHQRASDMEVEGPFGLRIRARGKEMASVLLVISLAVGLGYLVYQHDKATVSAAYLIQQNQLALSKSMEEMIYIMSLPEMERSRLEISMPESLRNKILIRHQEYTK